MCVCVCCTVVIFVMVLIVSSRIDQAFYVSVCVCSDVYMDIYIHLFSIIMHRALTCTAVLLY